MGASFLPLPCSLYDEKEEEKADTTRPQTAVLPALLLDRPTLAGHNGKTAILKTEI